MNDLDNLRPEVREAVEHCDRNFALAPYAGHRANWPLIRAELPRLARENIAYAETNHDIVAMARRFESERDEARAELAEVSRMRQQLLDIIGANDQADAIWIIAQHHARELAQSETPK